SPAPVHVSVAPELQSRAWHAFAFDASLRRQEEKVREARKARKETAMEGGSEGSGLVDRIRRRRWRDALLALYFRSHPAFASVYAQLRVALLTGDHYAFTWHEPPPWRYAWLVCVDWPAEQDSPTVSMTSTPGLPE
ncbi:MAG TPA: hypothetical protein VKQ36_01785, partial [Ktedonobacterales bacterium]|nr:hypothetical protein [Ktedonobacterales bacterium]